MECREARRLLDEGLTPGPRAPERAALGFHIAACGMCRSYWEGFQSQLLMRMLSEAEWPSRNPAPPAAAAVPNPTLTTTGHAGAMALRSDIGRWLWYAGLGVLATLGLLLALTVGAVAVSLLNIHRNLQAMIVTPIPAIAVAAELAPEPTARPPAPTSVPAVAIAPKIATAVPTTTPTAVPTAAPVVAATVAPPAHGGPINILLLGSDRRPSEKEPSRTDAIIIARIDPQTRRVALLSLPRDLIVAIPGHGRSRINAANMFGFRDGTPGGGPELARRTVANLLGIPIDYYVYIDFAGFMGAIDAIGGVNVDVARELYDPHFPTMDFSYTVAHFLPGTQHLDGIEALMYSRIRHPDSDFARMKRQQSVVIGAFERLRGQNVFDEIAHLEAITNALHGYVQTNLPEDRILGLAWALRELDASAIERYTLDQTMVTFGIGNDRWAEVARPGVIPGLVHKLMGSTTQGARP